METLELDSEVKLGTELDRGGAGEEGERGWWHCLWPLIQLFLNGIITWTSWLDEPIVPLSVSVFLSLFLPWIPFPPSLFLLNPAWIGFLPQATQKILPIKDVTSFLHSQARGGRKVTEVKWTAEKEVSPDLSSTKSFLTLCVPWRGQVHFAQGKSLCWQDGYCQRRRMSVRTLGICIGWGGGRNQSVWLKCRL